MGLLNLVFGALAGSRGGRGEGDALRAVVAMLAQQQGPGGGGLTGLVQQFEQGGLGELVASWIGTGRNLPVSAEQVQAALGSEQVGRYAAALGVAPGTAAERLSKLLPQVVDRLTPDGRLPEDAGLGDLDSVLARFSRR